MTKARTMFVRLRGRARVGIVVEGFAFALTALLCFMLVSYVVDRSLRLEEVYRFGLLVVFVASVGHLLRKHLFAPIRVDLNDDELALAMERGEEDLQQALISAVQFERALDAGGLRGQSTQLMEHVVTEVQSRVESLQAESALDHGRIYKFGSVIFACLAVVTAWGVLDADSLSLWARRNILMSSEEWPRATRLEFLLNVVDGKVSVAEGNDISVVVRASGVIPEQVWIHYEFPDGSTDKELMSLMGGDDSVASASFTQLHESLISNVKLHATGGDGLAKSVELVLVKRPLLKNLQITKTYPAYMQLEPEVVPNSEGDIRVPFGTKLGIAGEASKRLEKAYLTFGKEPAMSMTMAAGNQSFAGELIPEESGVLTVDVTDTDGLGAGKPPKLFLRVVPDRAPSVDYKTMGIGSMILFKALIPGSLRLRDDFGLTKVASQMRITAEGSSASAAEWKPVKLEGLRDPETEEGELEYNEKVVFDLLTLNDLAKGPTSPANPIRPGMLVSLKFEARDNYGPGEPHIGNSEILTLRIVTEDKLMQDLHRRQTERRRELTQILEKEKDHRIEVQEKLSPTSADPRAKQAQYQLQAIAREQRALQKQVMHISGAYEQILDEYFNNRVLKPAQILQQRQNIQLPLEKVAKEDFPTSAEEVAEFARSGQEDLRELSVGSYDNIIRVLEAVISNMRQLESVAGILEDIRKVRDAESSIKKATQKKLDDLDKAEKPKKSGESGGKSKKEIKK
jgi:hypothetical protein